jgi:hypothetical protein
MSSDHSLHAQQAGAQAQGEVDASRIVKDVNKGALISSVWGYTTCMRLPSSREDTHLATTAHRTHLQAMLTIVVAADCPVNNTLYTEEEFSGAWQGSAFAA